MKNTFTKFISKLLLILCFLFTGNKIFAQYTANDIATGGYYTAMAKDQSDNIYVVRYNGTDYEVARFTNGNPATTTILYTGLSSGGGTDIYSWGLAVNSLGDVFVTNAYQPDGWEIIMLRAPAYTASTIHTGNYYSSLAIDNSDNLLSLEYDGNTNNYRLMQYPAGAENAAGTQIYNGLAYPGGTTYPWGLTVDSHNDIYFLGFLETNGGSLFKLTYPGYALSTLGTNKSYTSLAVDASNNLYTTEGTSSTSAQVVKYTYPVAVNATGTALYTGLSGVALFYPWGLAVNSSGQIFANDGAAGTGRVVRLDPPTSLVSSITRLNANPTAAGSISYTVTFNKSVTGITTSGFSLSTTGSIAGAAITSVSGSGATYTVTINTGTGDGTIRLNVTGTGIVPTVTNVPYTSGAVYTIDKTKPTGSLVINSGATITNNSTVTLTTAATDATAIQMRFSDDGTSYSTDETLAASKSWALSAGDGLKTVYVQYIDAAGNVETYSSTITLDQTAPNTSVVTGPLNPTNSSSAGFSFSSTESPASYQASFDGAAFTAVSVTQTYTGIASGSHTLSVRAIDAAGNVDASPATYSWTVDLTAPAVSSVGVPANGYYKAGTTLSFAVNYSENVIVNTTGGTPYINIVLTNGTVHANYTSGSGTSALTFSYVVVNGDMDMDGPSVGANLQTNGGTIKDAADNNASVVLANVGSLSGILVNTVIPSVTLTTSEPELVNHPVVLTATFSEAVTGLTAADFTTINGAVTGVSTSDNITYSVTFALTANGPGSIIFPAAKVVNVGGNDNTASNTLFFRKDVIQPTVTNVAVPVDSFYIEGEIMEFQVIYTENLLLDVTGGNPYLNLTIGAAGVKADLVDQTGAVLTFRYTVKAGDIDLDGITVGTFNLNGATLKDSASNNAVLTLNGVESTAAVRVNTAHVPVVITTAAANVKAAYTATITFGGEVYDFIAGDIVVTNATLSNLQTTDNLTFTVLVTPTAEGTVTLNVPANAATNARSGNAASNTLSTTYDITAPVITSVSVPANGYYKAGDVLNFTATFGEPVVITGTPYVNVTIGSSTVQATLTGSTASSMTFSYTVVNGDQDMNGIAVGTLALNSGTIKDAAGNNATLTLNNTGSTTGVFVNTTHPSVVISTTAAATVNGAFTTTFTFSEAVTGFVIGDITAGNAVMSNLQTSDNITYTALVTPVTDGAVNVSVPANVAVNIGNNGNSASNMITVTYDATASVVTSVSVPANGYYKAGAALDFTVNYNENVTVDITSGKPFLNVVLTSGSVKAIYTGGNGTSALTFSYSVQAGDMDMDGLALNANLQLNGGIIKDVATNNASLVLNSVGALTGVFVNTSIPSVTITKTDPAYVNHAVTATITFSEAVTGLTAGDFNVTNATVSSLTTSDNIVYTVLITPAVDGNVNVSVPSNSVLNIGSNGNTVSDTLRFTYDGTKPTITSVDVPADSTYNAGNELNFAVHFSENILADTLLGHPRIYLTVGGTTQIAYYTGMASGNTLNFAYYVKDTDPDDLDGITIDSLTLSGSILQDAAANGVILTLNGVGSTTAVRVVTSQPSVVITTTAPALVNAPYSATITFSKAVTGFAITDPVVTNAILSNLQTSDNINYTVLVTPGTDGTVTVAVPANVAINAGNGNTASNTLSRIYDITPPAVSSVTVPANGYYQAGTALNFRVQFNDRIITDTASGKPYINVTIGTAVVRAILTDTTASSIGFRYIVQNGELDMDGITVGALNLNGSTIKDSAANNATLTLNNTGSTTGVFVNTVHPSVTVTTNAPKAVNTAFTATFTFSEAVTGFTLADITSNGTISNLQTTNNITFTALVTPGADGIISVSVPAGIAVNIGNNDNTVSDTLRVRYDATAPTVTSVLVPANGYYKAGQDLNFTVNFSEPVRIDTTGGKPYLNVVIGTTTVKAFYNAATLNFRYTVLAGQMDADGITIGTLVLNGGTIRDTVSNNAVLTLNNVGTTTGVLVNTATPSVVISTTAAARINTTFNVRVVFSEAVTGLAAADFNVTNGTAGNLQTTDNITYTATITPSADGTVSVFLPAGQAENVVTNTNTVSDTVSLVYDITAPVITASQTFTASERSPAGTLVGTVTAIEAFGTLQNWTITGDDSGGAFSVDNTGKILVKDVTILNSHVNTTVHLTITVSDGLNISTATSVAITIKYVNLAPVLDTIANVVMCTNTATQTIQLTGASATETDQTYGFAIMANQPYFDVLSVSATGLVTYQLKAGAAGTATVTVTIKDDGGTTSGGVDSLRRTFTVTANALPVIGISSDKGTTISKGDIIHLTATGGNSYSWEAAEGNISGAQSDILEARPMDNTTYKVTVSSAAGCKDSATIVVKVVEDFKVDAVNILSPNGDGKNDKWVIRNLDSYPNNEVKIFDRTGRMVYSRRNYSNDWDATMNGSPLAEGTYYYILTIEGGKTAKGYITIIRDRN